MTLHQLQNGVGVDDVLVLFEEPLEVLAGGLKLGGDVATEGPTGNLTLDGGSQLVEPVQLEFDDPGAEQHLLSV
jgi:hypothetical protein